MAVKHQIVCPYCENQGIKMFAVAQKTKAQKEDHARYGCANEHYFAVPTRDVQDRERL